MWNEFLTFHFSTDNGESKPEEKLAEKTEEKKEDKKEESMETDETKECCDDPPKECCDATKVSCIQFLIDFVAYASIFSFQISKFDSIFFFNLNIL